METHAHHLHKAPGKNFWHYFFEFLMLFLAVFCGFLAENFREHQVERIKEKEYLSSLAAELKSDTTQYGIMLDRILFLNPYLDSLYKNVKEANAFNYVIQGKWNMMVNEFSIPYKPGMTTIEQLKSSGNLRLIENKLISYKIMEYETLVHGRVENGYNRISEAADKVYSLEDELCDYTKFINATFDNNMQKLSPQELSKHSAMFEMHLVIKDTIRLNALANSFVNYKSRNLGNASSVNQAKMAATELIKLINDEYHFNNE